MAPKIVEALLLRWRARTDLGLRGELLAVQFLKRRGYEILARRWRCRAGEIDIVARDGDTVVIVEVKTRTRSDAFSPVDAVDRGKRRKLIQLAGIFASARLSDDVPIRFDVVAVTTAPGQSPEIELIENAFDASSF